MSPGAPFGALAPGGTLRGTSHSDILGRRIPDLTTRTGRSLDRGPWIPARLTHAWRARVYPSSGFSLTGRPREGERHGTQWWRRRRRRRWERTQRRRRRQQGAGDLLLLHIGCLAEGADRALRGPPSCALGEPARLLPCAGLPSGCPSPVLGSPRAGLHSPLGSPTGLGRSTPRGSRTC